MNRTIKKNWTRTGLAGLIVLTIPLSIGGCGDKHDHGQTDHHENPTTADHVATTSVVNAVCPIMGNEIDPTNVPERLTRQWKGKTVGFCCAACPTAWDKLSEADKDKKLAAALSIAGNHNGHDHAMPEEAAPVPE